MLDSSTLKAAELLLTCRDPCIRLVERWSSPNTPQERRGVCPGISMKASDGLTSHSLSLGASQQNLDFKAGWGLEQPCLGEGGPACGRGWK